MDRTEAEPPPGAGGPPRMEACGLTHTGRRPRNEDCHLIREDLGLVIVADGFSGAAGGDIAARVAVDEIAGCFGTTEEQTLPTLDTEELADGVTVATVRFAMEHAHTRVRYVARSTGPLGMSTAVAVLVVAGPQVVVGCAGNVHVDRLRADRLERLTREEPAGEGGPCPVGQTAAELRPRVCAAPWQRGDLYLVSTGGLHRVLGPQEIRVTLATHRGPEEAATALVARALQAGAADNMTVVVVRPVFQPATGESGGTLSQQPGRCAP